MFDPIQQRTIIGVGEAADRIVNRPQLTDGDMEWLNDLSSSSSSSSEQQQEDEEEENRKWGVLRKSWESLIRRGLHENPQDRSSILQIFHQLQSMKYQLEHVK